MQGIFRHITGSLYQYLDWRELFDELAIDLDDDQEEEYFWDMFLRSFYLSTADPGHLARGDSNNPGQFYRESGIPPSAVDWSEWRNLHKSTP